MQITLLGTGAAGGIPLFGCQCSICVAAKFDASMRRQPACALLEIEGSAYLIDAGIMDIGDRFDASFLDGIFLTHFHPDHVQGLFHIRWGKLPHMPVYCPSDNEGCADLYKHPGLLEFRHVKKYGALDFGSLEVIALPLIHSKLTQGYLFKTADKSLAYLTDTIGLPSKVSKYLSSIDIDCLVIDTSFPPDIQNRNHNNLSDTLEIHAKIQPKRTIMTHIGHELDYWLTQNTTQIPEGVIIGRDGMKLKL